MTNNSKKSKKNELLLADGQLMISYELLICIHWLVNHQPQLLKKLLQTSFKNGVKELIQQKPKDDFSEGLDLQQDLVDFFSVLEIHLQEILVAENVAIQEAPDNLMPTIDHVDVSMCDRATLSTSITRTARSLNKDQTQNAQETLFKEILKNWEPRDKSIKH